MAGVHGNKEQHRNAVAYYGNGPNIKNEPSGTVNYYANNFTLRDKVITIGFSSLMLLIILCALWIIVQSSIDRFEQKMSELVNKTLHGLSFRGLKRNA